MSFGFVVLLDQNSAQPPEPGKFVQDASVGDEKVAFLLAAKQMFIRIKKLCLLSLNAKMEVEIYMIPCIV